MRGSYDLLRGEGEEVQRELPVHAVFSDFLKVL